MAERNGRASRSILRFAATALIVASGGRAVAQGAPGDSYGFAGHEIYELTPGIANLRAGDLNGDGRVDLVIVNPGRSRIEMLVRLDPEAPDFVDESELSDDPNPVEYDGRYALRRRPEERRILALDVGDFDGDGTTDIAYATDTGELVVVYSGRHEELERVVTRKLDALRSGCDHLRAADVDADGFADLLVVADGALIRLESRGEDGWSEPETLDRIEDGLDEIHVCDLDGDGSSDLVYVFHGEDFPFRLRLGLAGGGFGPRTELDLPDVRETHAVDLDGDRRSEILAVFQASGRLASLELAALEPGKKSLARYHLEERKESKEDAGFALGDLDGNGVADLVISDPGAARVTVHLGREGARTLEGRSFPSLVGVRDPRIGDVDGDGEAELIVVSTPEKMIGVAALKGGRLPFPLMTAVDGEPAAMDVADVTGDGIEDVVLVATKGEGRKREYFLEVHAGSAEGLSSEPTTHEITGMTKVPGAIRIADLDRDGAPDVVAFLTDGRSAPVLLVQRDGAFVSDERGDDTPGLGILAGAGPRAMAWGDCDGDGEKEVLVCAENFARSMFFEPDDRGRLRPRVLEQFNGPAPDSAIESCTVLDVEGDGVPEVVLLDSRTRELLILERDESGDTRVRERVEAGRMRIVELASADLDGDGKRDLVTFAADQVGVLYAQGDGVTIREASFHEPKHAKIFIHALGAADMNADGKPDVVACETSQNAILILAATAGGLEHRLGFKVFDEKTFSNRGSTSEPREIVAADLTGDGKDDLAILVHDKLILYVQE